MLTISSQTPTEKPKHSYSFNGAECKLTFYWHVHLQRSILWKWAVELWFLWLQESVGWNGELIFTTLPIEFQIPCPDSVNRAEWGITLHFPHNENRYSNSPARVHQQRPARSWVAAPTQINKELGNEVSWNGVYSLLSLSVGEAQCRAELQLSTCSNKVKWVSSAQ